MSDTHSPSPSSERELRDTVPHLRLDVPGTWERDEDLLEHLPAGYEIDPDEKVLRMPGNRFVRSEVPSLDRSFIQMFAHACINGLPTEEEMKQIEQTRCVNRLESVGGSKERALMMSEAAGAILHAGGAGVYNHTSGRSIGRSDWLENHRQFNKRGLLMNMVAILWDDDAMWSAGMHSMGARDLLIPRSGNDQMDRALMATLLTGILNIEDKFAAETKLRSADGRFDWHLLRHECERFKPGDPRFNPYGMWRLVPMERV